jgi:hypothetical protein
MLLVEAARTKIREAGQDGPRALARAIGLTGQDEDKRVQNWVNGDTAPNYDGTMRLLQLAGWLNEDRLRAAQAAGQRAAQKAARLADPERLPQAKRKPA